MTLGNAATARARLIVWCKECRHQVEPDPAAMAERYGAARLAELRQSGLTLLWLASARAGFGGGFRQFDADLSDPSIGLVA